MPSFARFLIGFAQLSQTGIYSTSQFHFEDPFKNRIKSRIIVPRLLKEFGTPSQQSLAGWIPERMGRWSVEVGRRHPVTMRKAPFRIVCKCEQCDIRVVRSTQHSSRPEIKQLFVMLRYQNPILSPQVASAASRVKIFFYTMAQNNDGTRVNCPVLQQDKWEPERMINVYCCYKPLAYV